MQSRSYGNPYRLEARVLTRPWRLLRATVLSTALVWVYLTAPAHQGVGGLIGAGLGYVALTLLLDREPGSIWPRLRLLLDLALASGLAAVDGPGLSSPLRYLFVLPIIEASLTLGLEELLGSALLVLVAATALALRTPGGGDRTELLALAGGVLGATLLLGLLARDARSRVEHET
ncbi:MAG: hypothetical protein HUU35_16650, partial [Armatimonadetes bacterium]|nr:hypothetical protein [Armatimonadota bacterium]